MNVIFSKSLTAFKIVNMEVIVGLLLLIFSIPASAVPLAAFYADIRTKSEVEVVAGLDESTRQLIEKLPAEVRTQLLQGVREALPLIETSADKFAKRLDQLVSDTLLKFACTTANLSNTMPKRVVDGLLGKTPKEAVVELHELYRDRGKKFTASTAKDISVNYAGYLERATTVACVTSDPETLLRLDSFKADARLRAVTWREIETLCKAPTECMSTRYQGVKALIAKADRRDVEYTRANQDFAAVKYEFTSPDWIARTKSYLGTAKLQPAWIEYEPELIKIRSIEMGLNAAKSLRTGNALGNLAEAEKALKDGESTVAAAKLKLSKTDRNSNVESKSATEMVLAALSKNEERIAQAREGDATLTIRADATRDGFVRLKTLALSVVAAAAENIRILDAKPEKPERERRSCGGKLCKNGQIPDEYK